MMLAARRRMDRTRGTRPAPLAGGIDDADRARRFREIALPHLDAVYTLARYLMRNAADADDAVQECYLRAFRHFDTFHGGSIRAWLLAILRNVCRATFAQRGMGEQAGAVDEDAAPIWSEPQDSPEAGVLRRHDAQAIRGMISALPDAFRETLVLREVEDLSYREIAEIVGAPVGTVMSRLARARAMLRAAWLAAEENK